jgi:hypothetical protein
MKNLIIILIVVCLYSCISTKPAITKESSVTESFEYYSNKAETDTAFVNRNGSPILYRGKIGFLDIDSTGHLYIRYTVK